MTPTHRVKACQTSSSMRKDCQRALGLDAEGNETPSKAWPVLTKEYFEASRAKNWSVDPFWFTACTGNTSFYFSHTDTKKGANTA